MMTDHDVREWLNGAPATGEQMEQLADASALADRFAGDDDGAEQAFSTMAQVILGDETVDGLVAQMQAAESAAVRARDALYAGVVWHLAQGASEKSLAAQTGLSRTTIRRVIGK